MKLRVVFFFSVFALALTLVSVSRSRPAVIGDLYENSIAYGLGFRPGDQILKFAGKTIVSWESFCLEWAYAKGKPVEVEVQRGELSTKISLAPTPDSPPSHVGLRPFVVPAKLALKISSPLKLYGITDGDEVVALDGAGIKGFEDFKQALKNHPEGKPLNLDLVRSSDRQSYSIAVATLVDQRDFTLENLGIIHPTNVVTKVRPGSIGGKLGLLAQDRFVLIQGQVPQPTFNIAKFATAVRGEKAIKLAVVRLDKVQNLELKAEDISVPEPGDFRSLMDFLGVTTLAEGSSAGHFPSTLGEFQSKLWFQLAGKE